MNKNESMKVAILGGSGKMGGFLIQRVSEAGYPMRVLMRNPDKIKPSDERIQIVQGCDAVLSALRQRKGEVPICSTVTGHVLAVMKELGIRRYILVRAFLINAPGDHKDLRSKLMSMLLRSIIHETWTDWQKELDILLRSNMEWTLVRIPIPVEEPSLGQVRVDLASPPGKKISGYDIANFVVAQITEPTYVKKAPFIGN